MPALQQHDPQGVVPAGQPVVGAGFPVGPQAWKGAARARVASIPAAAALSAKPSERRRDIGAASVRARSSK
jgi:hypothetical protein